MDDRTFNNSSQVNSGNEPSDLLKQFIEALVEDVVLHGEPFDVQKKWLHKYCNVEHFDSDSLIANLTEFFDNMEELKSSESKAAVKLAYLQARDCYVSAATVDKLVEGLAKKRTNKAEEVEHNDSADDRDYVDLGLPSGTLWKKENEHKSDGTYSGNPFFTFDEAVRLFGTKLPTSDQFYELLEECEWNYYDGDEYEIVGPNGNSITLPALGCVEDGKHDVDSNCYWTSDTPAKERTFLDECEWDNIALLFDFMGKWSEDDDEEEEDGFFIDHGFYWQSRLMGCAVRTVCQK